MSTMANNRNISNFTLSANLMNGLSIGTQYFVTPNVNKVLSEIISYHQAGLHSFTIIGTYNISLKDSTQIVCVPPSKLIAFQPDYS